MPKAPENSHVLGVCIAAERIQRRGRKRGRQKRWRVGEQEKKEK